jgi:type IV secretory pathway TrbD component
MNEDEQAKRTGAIIMGAADRLASGGVDRAAIAEGALAAALVLALAEHGPAGLARWLRVAAVAIEADTEHPGALQ